MNDIDRDVALYTWNALDRVKLMRFWLYINLPKVNYHQKIYIPRLYQQLDIEEII